MPTILHFEDDQMILDMYAKKFAEAGFAYVGKPERPDPVGVAVEIQPDVIINDMIMPEMHGFKATELLKADERTKDIPVVGLTSLGQPADRQRGLAVGMTEYLVKAENTPDEVVKIVSELLNR